MARLTSGIILFLCAAAGAAQTAHDRQFKEAGVCARCHVISVIEWGMSRHRQAGIACVTCHGASLGHVKDERNNIKPERLPRGAAIAGLCAGCHPNGCPKTQQTASCQDCHHSHALVDPKKPAMAEDKRLDEIAASWLRFTALERRGEELVKAGDWRAASEAYRQALAQKPGDGHAAERLKMCLRRMNPSLPGFEILGKEFDSQSGLPVHVRVARWGIPMVLVPGGEFEMGSERFAGSKPVHTVRVDPFYLAQSELTQAEWKSLMGSNPSSQPATGQPEPERLPVDQISWDDCQSLLKKLNDGVPGSGFRLPTEAEWEFAARAGGGSPNALGLFGLKGGVWEWSSSLDRPYPYVASDGREEPDATGLRVLRGGGYAEWKDWLDPAARHSERPSRRLHGNGMRLARSVPAGL